MKTCIFTKRAPILFLSLILFTLTTSSCTSLFDFIKKPSSPKDPLITKEIKREAITKPEISVQGEMNQEINEKKPTITTEADTIKATGHETPNPFLTEDKNTPPVTSDSIENIPGGLDLSMQTVITKEKDDGNNFLTTPSENKIHTVTIHDGAKVFTPRRLKVIVGDVVRWESKDSTIDAHLFQSVPQENADENFRDEILLVDLYENKSYEHTFKKIGVYPYFCFIHKGMTGIIAVVREGQTIKEMKEELEAIITRRQEKLFKGGKKDKLFAKEMIFIEEGKFILGSPEEGTEGPVSLEYVPSFYIDKYEVTNEEYEEFINMTGYKTEGKWRKIISSGKEKYPVVNVTYNDAAAYAGWANKRLPTELEWEKAARGKDRRMWPWGNEFDNEITNVFGPDEYMGTSPVGIFEEDVSPYGLYDMAGNVSEWTSDRYLPYQDSPQPDYPDFSARKMVVRGGSFNTVYEDQSRTHTRTGRRPGLPSSAIGFRLVKDTKP